MSAFTAISPISGSLISPIPVMPVRLGKDTDINLVARAIGGEEAAFSELVRRHYDRVLRVSCGMLKTLHEAEDVVQDAFVKVHQRLADFNGNSAFYTWLYRIVVNMSIDALRKKKRERRVDIEDNGAREAICAGKELWPGLDTSDPCINAERRQLGQTLREAFSTLPDIHRDVIMMRELEGHSYEEIANHLGIKKGTVMSRLFHARKAMQDAVAVQQKREQRVLRRSLAAA